jgi:hypothetical protein
VESNVAGDICYAQPGTLPERLAIANDLVRRTGFPIPVFVDGMDNAAEKRYAAWPSRLYVVDEQGRVVFRGNTGPLGFGADEAETWLRTRFGD